MVKVGQQRRTGEHAWRQAGNGLESGGDATGVGHYADHQLNFLVVQVLGQLLGWRGHAALGGVLSLGPVPPRLE
ncbi:hypothetical protein GCM10009799_24220 [Nocardiopsis rhodophaea]|uniref:Uncharacterized protein n=1 Tax=Nocardiopsis rhodophaea TaxID=280238 RepID=A0ABN2T1C1_9ACTN